MPLRDDWSPRRRARSSRRPARSREGCVFIPSPNNPTGGLLPPGLVERLLDTGALLVVDEAYIEFSHATSLVARAAAGEPLVVLRTFSKWAGLAGLRVGYGVMPRRDGTLLMQIKQPYGLNVAAEVAALASLEDRALLDERACTITGERDALAEALRATGWLDPAPSEANFLLVPPRWRARHRGARGAARAAASSCARSTIRACSDHIRISVGTPEDTDRAARGTARHRRDAARHRRRTRSTHDGMNDRRATVDRETAETKIHVALNVDGSGRAEVPRASGSTTTCSPPSRARSRGRWRLAIWCAICIGGRRT